MVRLGGQRLSLLSEPPFWPLFIYFLNCLLFICVCTHACTQSRVTSMDAKGELWGVASLLSFHRVGPKDRTLAVRPGLRCPLPPIILYKVKVPS